MTKQSKKKTTERIIAHNRKVRHDYELTDTFEAGLVLLGWEIKSLRAGRAQLKESYVILKDNEAWLLNSHFSPLSTTSTHIVAEPTRSRKLLLNRREINRLRKAKEAQGYTIVPLDLHWKKNRAKLQIALAKGKKKHDKRQSEKDRDWQRQKQRILSRDR